VQEHGSITAQVMPLLQIQVRASQMPVRHISERDLAQLSVGYRYHPLNVHHDRLREGGKGPSIGSLVMRNQALADREVSVGSRPVDTSRWATSPILLLVSRAARRSLSKAIMEST
jgi:hypothetical protein